MDAQFKILSTQWRSFKTSSCFYKLRIVMFKSGIDISFVNYDRILLIREKIGLMSAVAIMPSAVIATLLAQRTLQVIRLYWKRWKDADVANTNAAWHTRWLERQTTSHRKCSYVQAIPSSATGGALVSSCMKCWLGSHLLWLILRLKPSTRYYFPYTQPLCVEMFNVRFFL